VLRTWQAVNFYEEFGLSRSATPEEIRQAHKNLARLLHPDQYQDSQLRALAECQMKRINAIYGVLSDPRQRPLYDRGLEPHREAPSMRRNAVWILTAILVALGIYGWLGREPRSPALTAIEAPAVAERIEAPGGPPADRRRILTQEVRQLRRLLDRMRAERDNALAHAARAEAKPIESPFAPVQSLAGAEVVEPEPAPRTPAAAHTVEQNGPKRLNGTWFYFPSAISPSRGELYPPEYIELNLAEQAGVLRGRYRGRFRIADRAISPEVRFQFSGKAGSSRYPWSGNGGAQGEIEITALSDNTLTVSWFTSQLGDQAALTSGTAMLVRRQDP